MRLRTRRFSLARWPSPPSLRCTSRELLREDEIIIVDGTQGVVVVNPDETVLSEYRLKQHQWELEKQKLARIRTAVAETLDGVHVELHANIELPATSTR